MENHVAQTIRYGRMEYTGTAARTRAGKTQVDSVGAPTVMQAYCVGSRMLAGKAPTGTLRDRCQVFLR